MAKRGDAKLGKHLLNSSFYQIHKVGKNKSDFGLDNSNELVENAFGIYSTANIKSSLGPFKVEHYRIGFMRSGSATISVGLEDFRTKRNMVVFGFPGQTFALKDPTNDFFGYYLLFKEGFVDESLMMKNSRERFPFFSYSGIQCFELTEQDGLEVENLIHKINAEVKRRDVAFVRAIGLYIQMILIIAYRNYEKQKLAKDETALSGNALFKRFVRMVNQHFLTHRKVSDYASLLHVSPDHLNRTIKSHSDKTAHELIDEMLLIEAKAQLLRTDLSVSQIAHHLEFTDPSHFNKFFKKLAGCTPLQYRSKSV